MKKHSVIIAGHATSITLEDAFWRELKAIARREGKSLSVLVEEIDNARSPPGERGANLSSAVRLFILADLQRRLS